MNHRRVVSGMLLLAATFGLHVASSGNSTSITGRIVDGAGYPVPGVSVAARRDAKKAVSRTTTGADGTYQFERLSEGTYHVDFQLLGFDITRRNNVRVRKDAPASVDATLFVSGICDCVRVLEPLDLRERSGQVVDTSGRPIDHARLEIVSSLHHEFRYTDSEGRFLVRVPIVESWPLTASASGFGTVTLQVSAASDRPIVLKLPYVGTTLPDTERFRAPCCPNELFRHGDQ
jgi:hypothetical protein